MATTSVVDNLFRNNVSYTTLSVPRNLINSLHSAGAYDYLSDQYIARLRVDFSSQDVEEEIATETRTEDGGEVAASYPKDLWNWFKMKYFPMLGVEYISYNKRVNNITNNTVIKRTKIYPNVVIPENVVTFSNFIISVNERDF